MTNLDQQWNIPPFDLRLSESEVHVWRASLKQPVSVVQNLQQVLMTEEVTRARRFYFEKDSHHFIVARGLLRTILGRYIDRDPRHLRFCYNSYGKPSLDFPSKESELNFNLSRSYELVLYVFTYFRQVGIDVEYLRSDVDFEQLAKHTFSPYEYAMFHALPEAMKRESFFNQWTCKEAYIKAKGKGLSIPLDQFDISLSSDEPVMLLHSREDSQETTRWSLRTLAPAPGYAGALAVGGNGWHLRYWQWQE